MTNISEICIIAPFRAAFLPYQKVISRWAGEKLKPTVEIECVESALTLLISLTSAHHKVEISVQMPDVSEIRYVVSLSNHPFISLN